MTRSPVDFWISFDALGEACCLLEKVVIVHEIGRGHLLDGNELSSVANAIAVELLLVYL